MKKSILIIAALLCSVGSVAAFASSCSGLLNNENARLFKITPPEVIEIIRNTCILSSSKSCHPDTVAMVLMLERNTSEAEVSEVVKFVEKNYPNAFKKAKFSRSFIDVYLDNLEDIELLHHLAEWPKVSLATLTPEVDFPDQDMKPNGDHGKD